MKVNQFLKVLEKVGYPNSSIRSIAKALNYDLENFLLDLKNEIGEKGVADFCDKAIEKLTGKDGLRVDLSGPNGDEFVYIQIFPMFYDERESKDDVISRYKWGKSHVLGTTEDGDAEYMTIQEVIDNTGMGEWSELDELLDHIKQEAYIKVMSNCGFGIWWE